MLKMRSNYYQQSILHGKVPCDSEGPGTLCPLSMSKHMTPTDTWDSSGNTMRHMQKKASKVLTQSQ